MSRYTITIIPAINTYSFKNKSEARAIHIVRKRFVIEAFESSLSSKPPQDLC